MRTRMLILPLLLLGAAPAAAESPVGGWELNNYIGSNLHGYAHANLGVVGAANRHSGTIAVVGRHGELATVHTTMLVKDGKMLKAPALSVGDIARASNSGRSSEPFTAGTITIEELEIE